MNNSKLSSGKAKKISYKVFAGWKNTNPKNELCGCEADEKGIEHTVSSHFPSSVEEVKECKHCGEKDKYPFCNNAHCAYEPSECFNSHVSKKCASCNGYGVQKWQNEFGVYIDKMCQNCKGIGREPLPILPSKPSKEIVQPLKSDKEVGNVDLVSNWESRLKEKLNLWLAIRAIKQMRKDDSRIYEIYGQLVDFIRELLQDQEKRIIKEIENNLPKADLKEARKHRPDNSVGFMLGWNFYEDKLLEMLRKENKE